MVRVVKSRLVAIQETDYFFVWILWFSSWAMCMMAIMYKSSPKFYHNSSFSDSLHGKQFFTDKFPQ